MKQNKISGIYKITNNINGKVYVGLSIDIHRRWKEHKSKIYRSKYKNSYLYNSFDKHKINNFTFEIIEKCKQQKIIEREIYWIEYYDSYKNGYNITSGGQGTFGYKHTDEDKKIMSDIKIKQRFEPWNKGKTNVYSEETKKLMSEAKIGRVFWNNGKNNPMYGKTPWNKGKKMSDEYVERTANFKGYLRCIETGEIKLSREWNEYYGKKVDGLIRRVANGKRNKTLNKTWEWVKKG